MITRALSIFAVACLAGAVHLIVLNKPISLTLDTTAEPYEDIKIPDTDPHAQYAANSLFDEQVLDTHITMRQAWTLYNDGATFLDARHDHEYEEGHIAGAIWMHATRLTSGEGIPDAYAIDSSLPVVVYCEGGECDASENTAIKLLAVNPDFKVYILGKGYDDWAAVGLPVEGFGVDASAEEASP